MKQGFTLMEILIALLVVSIGIISIIGVLVSSLETNNRTRDDMNIVSFADLVLNHLHAEENWNHIPTSGSFSLVDYNETEVSITIGTPSHFTAHAIGKDGNSLEHFNVTYLLDLHRNVNTIIAELQIWPGYSTNENPRFFQTEIYNWRKD